jgi:(E)-4-hydroxy-3-methylbut-2-enyl-diphosphate synthase
MGATTRQIKVRDLVIGGGAPISVQTMCATRTRDVDATIRQMDTLEEAGADLIRIAVDDKDDVEALKSIRKAVKARLVVDLQENFRLAELVAPFVDKIRYNPGHLHRLEKSVPIEEKVAWLVGVARAHGIALRVGVNCGSIAPGFLEKAGGDRLRAIVDSAVWHANLLDGLGFTNFVVSLKDSDPQTVVLCNKSFAHKRPDVPIHLGVTEAGLLPEGVIKTRVAFEQLIPGGIGDTIRVSLTLKNEDKNQEIFWGREILKHIAEGRLASSPHFGEGLNIISCPSCSRVQNEDFVKLAMEVKEMTVYAAKEKITIAVMGCRVNGPGETDEADLGLWCGPGAVVLKRKSKKIGSFSYRKILPALKAELDQLIAEKNSSVSAE